MSLMRLEEPKDPLLAMPPREALIAGIDFGTTQSLIAVYQNGEAVILADETGRAPLPSIVHVSPTGTKVGWEAMELLGHAPDKTFFSIKRWLGLDQGQSEALSDQLPYQPTLLSPGCTAFQVVHGDGSVQLVHPVELAAKIFYILRQRAENYLNAALDGVVVAVPAYFNEIQRKSIKDAAVLAGLKVLRLLSEPTAAALAYCQTEAAEADAGAYLAVYDFGGGTFDFSVLKKSGAWLEVVATSGDAMLGGDDIDAALAEQVQAAWEKSYANVLLGEEERRRQWQQWLLLCRQAKEALSCLDHTKLSYGRWEVIVTRETVERFLEPLVDRTLSIIRSTLAEHALDIDRITRCFFVGGTTKIPALRRKVEKFFGQSFSHALDPEFAVAQGAVYHAHELVRINRAHDPGSGYTLLDVTPFSLGLEALDGKVEVFLPRNTPLPATVTQMFTNASSGQTAVPFKVLQGEFEEAQKCQVLAEFVLDGLAPRAAGEQRIAVEFSVDSDGILTVRAQDASTGVLQEVRVQPSYVLPPALREQLLAQTDRQVSVSPASSAQELSSEKGNVLSGPIGQAMHLIRWLESHPRWQNLLNSDSAQSALIHAQWEALKTACRDSDAVKVTQLLAWFEDQNLLEGLY